MTRVILFGAAAIGVIAACWLIIESLGWAGIGIVGLALACVLCVKGGKM